MDWSANPPNFAVLASRSTVVLKKSPSRISPVGLGLARLTHLFTDQVPHLFRIENRFKINTTSSPYPFAVFQLSPQNCSKLPLVVVFVDAFSKLAQQSNRQVYPNQCGPFFPYDQSVFPSVSTSCTRRMSSLYFEHQL